MHDLPYIFAVTVVLAALLAGFAIAGPRRLWLRVTAVVVAALFMPAAYLSQSALLSRPKPTKLEWAERAAPEATVLGATFVENKAIFVWLVLPGVEEPRAYVLPWSKPLAEQLTKAQRDSEGHGEPVRMRKPFESERDDSEKTFYADPQRALPEKTAAQEQAPLVYQRPDNGQ
ncbi:MAG: hypothetical protein ACM3N5_12780 [Candidatus Eiseniibacteriota bacterium]